MAQKGFTDGTNNLRQAKSFPSEIPHNLELPKAMARDGKRIQDSISGAVGKSHLLAVAYPYLKGKTPAKKRKWRAKNSGYHDICMDGRSGEFVVNIRDGMDYSWAWVTQISKTAHDILSNADKGIIEPWNLPDEIKISEEEIYHEIRGLEQMKMIKSLQQDTYKVIRGPFKISDIADKVPIQKKPATCSMGSYKIGASIEFRHIYSVAKLLGITIYDLELIFYPYYLIVLNIKNGDTLVDVRDGITGKKQSHLNGVMTRWVKAHPDLLGYGCISGASTCSFCSPRGAGSSAA